MKRKSYCHRGGSIPLLGVTIDSYLRQVVSKQPENEALVAVSEKVRFTYSELDQEVEDLARGLLALGIKKGDRVGIWATDTVGWIVIQWATARIGAILVNINPAYRLAELKHALKKARIGSLFLIPSFKSSMYVDMVKELCPELNEQGPEDFSSAEFPELRHLVVFDPQYKQPISPPARGFLTWADVIERGREISAAQVEERSSVLDPDDPINIQFTSGTTGFPKAVVLTHHSILNNAYFVGELMSFTEADRLCVPVPFYHCFGMVVSNLCCLARGGALVIPSPHFEAGATLRAIQEEKCTALHGVPTMFVAELEVDDFDRYDLSTLRTGIMAGAPCPPELMKSVIEKMGCRELLIGYGMTEASPVTHLTRFDDSFERRVETVGTNLPYQEAKVVNPETGQMVVLGEQGELCFRGYNVMRGYFDDPEATANTIDAQGWLHTGDLGVMDEDGYVRVTGRLKDMIIRGGENIYPAEIESILFEHPDIMQVAVFGVADERMGEEVAAWVQLQKGRELSVDAIRDYAKKQMAYFKVPRYLWIVDEFPMTVTEKIQKFRMKEIAEKELTLVPS